MAALRVGVVGLGRGRMFVELFSGNSACEVVAVCDPVERALAPYDGLKAHTDYGAFLAEGLDIVAVISPGPVHAEQSVAAMESGAHVLCETPCVYSEDEARRVIRAAKETKRAFMLAEDYIWMGWAVRIRDLAEQGAFGRIVYAEGDYTHDCRDIMLATSDGYIPYRERGEHPDAVKTWRATDLPPLFYTSHTLGPLLHVMGDRIVSAAGLSAGTNTAPDLGTIDLEAGLFQTEEGAVIRLTNGFTVAHPYALYYNLVGTEGSAKFQNTGTQSGMWYSETQEDAAGAWQPMPSDWFRRQDNRDHVEVMVEEFVSSVVHDTPPPIDMYRSLDFVLPGITAHRSAMAGGKKLDVPDPRDL